METWRMDQNQNNQPSLVERIQATPESAAATDAAISAKQKEEKETNMADVTQQDIFNLMVAVKDSRHDVIDVTGSATDRLQKDITDAESKNLDRFYSVGRDTQDLRAQVTALGYQVRDGFTAAAKDTEIASLKTQIDAAKNTATLVEKIASDGEKTRDLINDLKYQDLNRHLIERNAVISEERWGRRHWRGAYDQAQFAAVSSQMQNFGSQLQETRQGMVNFGTMAGVGQTSSSNNV